MIFERVAAALGAGTIAAASAVFATGALAVSLPKAPSVPASPAVSAPIELAHGCHRGIQRDYSGWHFHTRACVRVPTAPPGLYDTGYNRRYYRGPLCTYRCKYVGPVKTCSQICR